MKKKILPAKLFIGWNDDGESFLESATKLSEFNMESNTIREIGIYGLLEVVNIENTIVVKKMKRRRK